MKISYNWLKEYVPELPEAEKLRDVFTYHLCEVESVMQTDADRTRTGAGKGRDWIFDLNILPNRAHDLLSHRGVAFELAGLLALKFQIPSNKFQTNPPASTRLGEAGKSQISKTKLEIKIESPKCRRYMGRVVREIKIGQAPKWIKERLESIGQRSVNSLVDAANFVESDIGQPVHIFDLDKLKVESGKLKVIVRNAKSGEKMTTLDNKEVVLSKDDLVIADDKNVLAIAGVKGGKKAEVDENTKNIVIEVANFDPRSVRKSAHRTGIHTSAVKRFENNLSATLCTAAMNEITAFIGEFSGGKIEEAVDIYPQKEKPRKLIFTKERIGSILGVLISAGEIEKIFQNYKYEYKEKDNKFSAKGGPALGWEISVPPLRLDLEIEEDMAEEIGRVIGYDKIKPKIPLLRPRFAKATPGEQGFAGQAKIDFKPKINKTFYKILWARKKLLDDGYSEVMTYTFRNKGRIEVMESASDKKFLRPNLSDGLKESYELNKINAPLLRQSEIKIFEIGTVFTSDTEQTHVAYADKKGVVEKSLDEFCKDIKITESYNELLGARSPSFAKATAGKQKPEAKFKMWSLYPFIIRDISVWLPETASKKELAQILKKNAGELLVHEPWLIDEYKKEGRTSYAFRLVFQAMDRTLTDEEVNEIMEKIGEKMAKKGWQVR